MQSASKLVKKQSNKNPKMLSKYNGKIQKWVTCLCVSIMTWVTTLFPAQAANINTNMSTETMIGGIIDFIVEVAKYMGFIVVAAGIFMFVFAYKDDNAEAQSRAARFAVVGAILLGLKPILKMTGLITG